MEKKFIDLMTETLEVEGKELKMTDKFREFEEWDSLKFLSVIAMIDEEYDVIIEGNRFQQLHTLADIYNEIQSKL